MPRNQELRIVRSENQATPLVMEMERVSLAMSWPLPQRGRQLEQLRVGASRHLKKTA
jgi:hypothetical protein